MKTRRNQGVWGAAPDEFRQPIGTRFPFMRLGSNGCEMTQDTSYANSGVILHPELRNFEKNTSSKKKKRTLEKI